jgi:two-component system LytT family response regulator
MIQSVIIDDEQNSRDFLEKMIDRYLPEKLQVSAKVGSIGEAMDVITDKCPDLVFLDIKLNDQSGLELLYHYKDANLFDVIFVTGYKDYAIDAVRYNAIDYIMKPVSMVDLVTAVKRYEKKKFESKLNLNSVSNNNGQENNKRESIAFPSKNGFKLEQISSIIYCEAKGNYTDVHIYAKGQILVSKTLKKVEEMIDHSDFFRIHKSFYLNMNFISAYNRSENLVELTTGSYLPVSVRKNESFIKKLVGRN